MTTVYTQELIEFGLSEKEAWTYLALLELEVATANEIAKRTGINRSSTYVVLESLTKKGLASITVGKKIKEYVAASPEQLARLAKQKSTEKIRAQKAIDSIVPGLHSLYGGLKKKPHVQIFEGKAGFISSFEETLKSKEKIIRVVSSTEKIQETLPDYLPSYVERRMQLGISMHGIHPFSEGADYLRKNIAQIDDVQLISPEKWPFMSDFVVFDNSVGLMLHDEMLSIHIESAPVADVMKKIFNLAFEEAKRLNIQGSPAKSRGVIPK